jgi:hypothetical protein
MIKIFKKDPTLRLRATRMYLVTVLACVLLLFSFNIVSLYEQQHKGQQLSSSSLELAGEQIAVDLGHRINFLAADCLSRTAIYSLGRFSAQDQSMETLRSLRSKFEGLRQKHRIAQHFFIYRENRIIFPRTSIPQSRPIQALFPKNAGVEYRVFAQLLRKGEDSERLLRRPAEAVFLYDRAAGLKVSDRLKAAALFRKARAFDRAGEQESAVRPIGRC